MPKFVQNKMINMFNNHEGYNLLLGTNSISEGINTPTKHLFIHPDCNDIYNRKLLLKNTIGRAGRLGEYPIGHIYSCSSISDSINDKVEISLSINEEDELKEILDTSDEKLINELCETFNIDKSLYETFREETKLSITKIRKILKVLKEDLKYAYVGNLPFMVKKVFDEYNMEYAKIDNICIRGVLQWKYYDDGIAYNLKSYNAKINFYRLKSNNLNISNSTIIDHYMRFMYSTLEYYIIPIAKIAKVIYEECSEWEFGNNVVEMIKIFWERYNSIIININDYDNFTDEQKIILQSLRDYGIQINVLNHEMIKEIEEQMNVRYSTYDIINAIKKLTKKSEKYKAEFKNINNKYL